MHTPIITEERRIDTLVYGKIKIPLYVGTYNPTPLAECFCNGQKNNESIHIDRRAVESYDDDTLMCCILHEVGHLICNTISIPLNEETDGWILESIAWDFVADRLGKRPVIDTLTYLIKRASDDDIVKECIPSLKLSKALIILKEQEETKEDYDNQITFEPIDKPGFISYVTIRPRLIENDTTFAEKIFARSVMAYFRHNEKRKFNQMEV